MQAPQNNSVDHALSGRTIYILVAVALVQFMFPLTDNGGRLTLVLYQVLYALLFGAAAYAFRQNRSLLGVLVGFGVVWGATVPLIALDQGAATAQLVGYITYSVIQLTVMRALIDYIFSARHITRDVIYAAVTIYLLIGAVFVPVYGLIDTLTVTYTDTHAFRGAFETSGGYIAWQELIYFSYVALTTLGFGDIAPATLTAKSAVALQSVIGVLYLTIIMARLVSLYTAEIQQTSA